MVFGVYLFYLPLLTVMWLVALAAGERRGEAQRLALVIALGISAIVWVGLAFSLGDDRGGPVAYAAVCVVACRAAIRSTSLGFAVLLAGISGFWWYNLLDGGGGFSFLVTATLTLVLAAAVTVAYRSYVGVSDGA